MAITNTEWVNLKPTAVPERGELVLGGFIERRPEGVFVDIGKLSSAEEFQRMAERIFSSGYYFKGLDYARFQQLLYDFEQVRNLGSFRLAAEIREFPADRRALYKGMKIEGGNVQYIFEPVLVDGTVDEPLYETGEDGKPRMVGCEHKTVTVRATLEVDEFVADMWNKGIRFGIDVAKVGAAIREGRCERMVVACELLPGEGRDAGIEEQTPELHRDDAPRELSNGRVDLRQFKNRFPQMKKGALLLKKTPRMLGTPGRSVAGRILEAALPKDFELASLAGEGTRVESHPGGEYLIAAMDGFLNIDTKTNRLSITEKIVNRQGVSVRTTGNLDLAGDQYEEFGDVQEGGVVEGKNLTFHADVFGKVVSSGGRVVLEHNLVGGTAINRRGSIDIAGLASNAVVHATAGGVCLKRAENSLLVGERVEVEWAANCTILADEVEIGTAAGCAIAGKRIHLGTAQARSGGETLVSMLLPDFSEIARQEEKEKSHIGDCEERIAHIKRGIDHLLGQPELSKYFTLAGKIHRKEIVLTAEQQGPWNQMRARLAPALKRITSGREDIKSQEGEIAAARERLAALALEREKALQELECRLDGILGEVVVRSLPSSPAVPPLDRLAPRELKLRLRATDAGARILFAGNSGDFAWRPERKG